MDTITFGPWHNITLTETYSASSFTQLSRPLPTLAREKAKAKVESIPVGRLVITVSSYGDEALSSAVAAFNIVLRHLGWRGQLVEESKVKSQIRQFL